MASEEATLSILGLLPLLHRVQASRNSTNQTGEGANRTDSDNQAGDGANRTDSNNQAGDGANRTASDNQAGDGANRTWERAMVVVVGADVLNVIVIRGSGDIDTLLGELSRKDGPLPASKASIDAMPTVEISETGECAICLQEYEMGEKAREMPCKHRFHPGCIEKWLGIHGSCPVCRFMMPVEEGEERESKSGSGEDGQGEEGEERMRVDGEIGVSITMFSIPRRALGLDVEPNSGNDSQS